MRRRRTARIPKCEFARQASCSLSTVLLSFFFTVMLPPKQLTFLEPGSSKQTYENPPTIPSTSKVETAVKKICKSSITYEYRMKDLESKLSEDLSNFRAVEGLVQESYKALQRNSQRAERALNVQASQIKNDLEDLTDTLMGLAETLPTTQAQVSDIRYAYDSGREKAQSLVEDLTWLNTDFYERWRMTIFTSSSPVSSRWKVLMRAIFVISFLVCFWLLWIGMTGAIRAHRHRLVWGEKLIS